jgi:LysM repeat protein
MIVEYNSKEILSTCKNFIMSKWLIALFFITCTNNFLFAQNIEIKGVSPNLYLEHIVAPKETLYSVARLYNSSPRELAAYNHLSLQSGLQIGQILKILLDKNNFTQSGVKAKNEALIPVYHTIASGETLYRLGVNYNKVPLSSLKKWNHLSSDEVTVGTPMVVGYLKVDKTQSALAQQSITPAIQVATTQVKTKTPSVKPTEAATENTSAIKDPAPKTETPVTTTAVNKPIIAATPVTNKGNSNSSEGYFKNLYDQQIANKTLVFQNGSAGVFKSTSGWQDGKYYCFYNGAAPGSILKIINSMTRESVYAKVLDAIPDIKQNVGLLVVISNAAANGLGVGEDKFPCTISYVR